MTTPILSIKAKVLTFFALPSILASLFLLVLVCDLLAGRTFFSNSADNILFSNTLLFFGLLFCFMMVGVAFYFSRRVTASVKKIENALQEVGKGNFDTLLQVKRKDEIGQLMDAFNQMILHLKTITDERNQESFNDLRSVIDGQEMERQRLSREIHDGLGQLLIAIKLKLESINHTDMSKIRYMISHVKELFDKTIDEIRRISNDLMPTVLNEFGLEKAIRRLCNEISEFAKIPVICEIQGNFDEEEDRLKMYLYRIVQEALNNLYKYAQASKAEVHLNRNKDAITLCIRDDGKGFVFDQTQQELGNGLRNMAERVHLLGGKFQLIAAPDCGTQIDIDIPIARV